mmetsp:Transcript_297/g.1035  ORF Transcript_297/g.1035 Transcript_297/m.1035 type:complete len:568 (-) Transcript_297:33-1736(-)
MNRYLIERLLFKGGQAFIYQVSEKQKTHSNAALMDGTTDEMNHHLDSGSGSNVTSFDAASGSITASFTSSEREDDDSLGVITEKPKLAMKRILVESISEANSALKELLLLSNLSHSHMISYTDMFIDESGGGVSSDDGSDDQQGPYLTSVCLIMKLYTKGDLDSFVRSHYKTHGPLKEEQVLDYMRQLVNCIAYLHKKGIIHRDIKPLNVLVDEFSHEEMLERGTNKRPEKLIVSDFGLSTNFSQKSMKSTFCGSLNYVSPALIRGKYASSVDIWALGCVMYYLLTGQERIMYMDMLQDREETLEEISNELSEKRYSDFTRDVLFRMLEDDRKGETASAEELLEMIDRILSGEALREREQQYMESNEAPDMIQQQQSNIEMPLFEQQAHFSNRNAQLELGQMLQKNSNISKLPTFAEMPPKQPIQEQTKKQKLFLNENEDESNFIAKQKKRKKRSLSGIFDSSKKGNKSKILPIAGKRKGAGKRLQFKSAISKSSPEAKLVFDSSAEPNQSPTIPSQTASSKKSRGIRDHYKEDMTLGVLSSPNQTKSAPKKKGRISGRVGGRVQRR